VTKTEKQQYVNKKIQPKPNSSYTRNPAKQITNGTQEKPATWLPHHLFKAKTK
jgi:long-subunit fatty acid transport protein